MITPKCRWCGGDFFNSGDTYWCTSESCRRRQSAYSIAVQSKEGTHFLYVPLPVQAEVEEIACRVMRGGRSHKILFGGAAGPGKSTAGRHILYRRCLSIPGFHALILRENFPELERSHMLRMGAETDQFKALGIDISYLPSKFRMKFPNGSIIEMGHMEDERAVRKYLSAEYDAVLADEAVLYHPDALMGIIGRTRTSKQNVRNAGGPLFLAATNPGGPSATILRDLCILKQPDLDKYPQLERHYHAEEFSYVAANLEDNPYLDPDYEADLALNQPWRFQQLRYNNWDIVAGQFFDEFRPNPTNTNQDPIDWTHVADLGDPPPDVEWFRSADWGYVNPGCVLWWACLPDGIYYIRHEWKFSHMGPDEVPERILDMTDDFGIPKRQIRYTVVDPSIFGLHGSGDPHGKGERLNETFARHGLSCMPADNDRKSGWARVRSLFRKREDGRPWLCIHPDCRYLIRTLSEAVSARHDPEDVDTNIDDHAIDAARYGAMSRPAPTRRTKRLSSRSFLGQQRKILDFRRRLSVRR